MLSAVCALGPGRDRLGRGRGRSRSRDQKTFTEQSRSNLVALASTLARSFRGRIIGTQHRRPPTVRAPSPSHARAPLIALQHNSLLHQPAVRGASHANHQLSRNFVAKPQATIVLILFARAADYYSHMAELRDAISNAERHPLQSAVRAHPSPKTWYFF